MWILLLPTSKIISTTMIKPEFYWKITDPENGNDDVLHLVVAPNIEEAIHIYISQFEYFHMEDITRVEQLGTVLVDFSTKDKSK